MTYKIINRVVISWLFPNIQFTGTDKTLNKQIYCAEIIIGIK